MFFQGGKYVDPLYSLPFPSTPSPSPGPGSRRPGVMFRYHMCGAGMGTLFLETRAPGAEEWDLAPGGPQAERPKMTPPRGVVFRA